MRFALALLPFCCVCTGAWQKNLPKSLELNTSELESNRRVRLGPSSTLVNTRLELLGLKAARGTKGRPGPLLAELQRAMVGADVGFKGYLRVRGVGYRFAVDQPTPAEVKADPAASPMLHVSAGLSHPLVVPLNPEFTHALTRKFRMLRLRSKGLNSLTQTLSALRAMRPPDVYKGKGIRYRKDNVIRKEGKKKKA
jgi:large subunit ribosomal protein L6